MSLARFFDKMAPAYLLVLSGALAAAFSLAASN
jgi:hypothetical protein